MKYRKKPVVIEATEWDETLTTLKQIGCNSMSHSGFKGKDVCTSLRIETLEGTMRVNKGDYIIKGVAGEFYPCNPIIFWQTYELAE